MRLPRRTPLGVPLRDRLRVSPDPALLRDVLLVCLASGVVGVSFGAIAVTGGLPVWVPVVMSLVVYAGSAQFSAVGVLLAGGGPVAAAATGLVLNTRTAAYSLAVAGDIGRHRLTRLLGAHLVTDETVAFTLAQSDPARRRAAFWTSGLALFAVWNTAVVVGALAGQALGDTSRYGLDAAFPAILAALVVPTLRKDAGVRRPAALGVLLALAATPLLPTGVPVLIALLGLLLYEPSDPGDPSGPGGPSGPGDPGDPSDPYAPTTPTTLR